MWTIFFDIDCTLIRTGGAGLQTILELMGSHHGTTELPEVQLHGRTDLSIWQELYEKLQLEMPSDIKPMIEAYCDRLVDALGQTQGTMMPGARELLTRLHAREDVASGLLTGNAHRAALIKMQHFDLHELVLPFGGFGDRHTNRDDVAALAVESAREFLGDAFDLQRTWVIGDTDRDVQCAKSIGAKVIAVATGNQSQDHLKRSNPDLVVADLSDVDYIEQVLTGSVSAV